MKTQLIKTTPGRTVNVHIVALGYDAHGLTDAQLIAWADNGIHKDPKNPETLVSHNFGGMVERRKGLKTATTYAKITVYID